MPSPLDIGVITGSDTQLDAVPLMFSCFHNAQHKDKGPPSTEGSGKYVPYGIILDGLYIYLSWEVL